MSPFGGGLAALSFPHAAPPPGGTFTEVAPGVRWLRMPLPFALNHINLWLVDDGAGWAIVDTGLADDTTKALWEQLLATALDGRPVTRVIVTHYHPDHMGLAGWLTDRLGVELWVTETEWLHARMLSLDDTPRYVASLEAFYRRLGFAAEAAEAFAARGNDYIGHVSPVPYRFHRLADGMELPIGDRGWRVVVGRGHAPEHACLYCPELDLLIAGDQVLPKISPNVGVWHMEPEADTLGFYLASLAKLRGTLPPSCLVLPSHNLPFHGLHTRIEQLEAHHEARLTEVAAACSTPRNALEIVPVLFPRALDPHQMRFAVGEALSHLHHAVALGRLARYDDEDGVWHFVRR